MRGLEAYLLEEKASKSGNRRALGLGCAGLALVVVLGGLATFAWARALPPPEEPHVRLPGANGYDTYCAIALRLGWIDLYSPLNAPLEADPGTVRAALKWDQAALEEMRQALRLPYVRPPFHDINAKGPPVGQLRDVGLRFVGEARLKLLDGKPGLAMRHALDSVELGTRIGNGGDGVSCVVGALIAEEGAAAAAPCVSRMAAAEIRTAGRRIDRALAQAPSLVAVTQEERRKLLLMCRQIFSNQGRGFMEELGSQGPIPGEVVTECAIRLYPQRWG